MKYVLQQIHSLNEKGWEYETNSIWHTHNDKGIQCAMAELLNIEDVDNNK